MQPGRFLLGLAVLATAAACDEEFVEIDPFPVPIESRSGAVFVGISDETGVIRSATVDTLSPITIVDAADSEANEPERSAQSVTIYSPSGTPRLSFRNTVVFDLHPCDTGGPFVDCNVGLDDDISQLGGIVGTNLLTRHSVRFDFAASELRFFPDTAGTDNDRGELCEALFDNPYAGGGTLVVADGEVDYSANRPALGACLDSENPAPDPEAAPTERGVDVLLVVSTGIGPSVLSQSAYNRYAAATGVADADALADAVLHLPSGPVGAKRGVIGHITLLGEVGTDSQNRGPCRELYANRVLSINGCNSGLIPQDQPCFCPDNKRFCRVGAALLLSGDIDVAVLPDEHPLLQGLRVELRPEFPEVDGVLGASALAATRLDFDYPNQRILGRCSDSTNCATRPQINRIADLPDVQQCLGI